MLALLGSKGFVGNKLLKKLHYKSIDTAIFTCTNRNSCSYKNLKNFLITSRATFLLNAAGFTGKPNVDACESAKYECLQGNAVLPGIIREVCED